MRAAIVVMLSVAFVGIFDVSAGTIPGMSSDAVDQAGEVEKRKLVADFLRLTNDESRRFWPIYARLQADLARLQGELEDHLRNYGRDYASMTDILALTYTRERLRNHEEHVRLLNVYIPRFLTALPGRKLARYYQIEERLYALVSSETAAEIPLLE
jgi:hypothetical protein